MARAFPAVMHTRDGTPRGTRPSAAAGRWIGLCLLWLALLAGCASQPAAHAVPGPAQQVAPGVYLLRGTPGLTETGNLGRVGNAGFIVGPEGVLAIDTGTSYLHGRALLARIAEVTDKPVRMVIVTHTRQEFLFGANAFRERGIPVAMHVQAARLMAARCEGCLKTLRNVVGEPAMAGTSMFKADVEFDANFVPVGIGRPVQVLHFGHSSGPGDVAVLDETTGTLFAGGLLDNRRIPDIQDSKLPAWEQALTSLSRLPLKAVVPGHGPAGGPELIARVQRYLGQLQAKVGALLASGVGLGDAVDQAEVADEFRGWDGDDIIHRRNVSVAYLRAEQALLFK